MLSRRDLMGKLAASAAVLLAAGTSRAALAPASAQPGATDGGVPSTADDVQTFGNVEVDPDPPATASVAAPWELITPLAMGSMVAGGWRVAGLSGAVNGSCVLTLQNARGWSQRVHMCRNEGRPQGLVYTNQFDLLVMNGGSGDLPTDEGLAQAVAEIAHRLAANENAHAEVVASLASHDRRIESVIGAGLR